MIEVNEINGRHIPIFLVLCHFVCWDIWPLGDVLVLTRGLHHHRPNNDDGKGSSAEHLAFSHDAGCETEAEASAF